MEGGREAFNRPEALTSQSRMGAHANSYTGPKQKELWKAITEQKRDDAIRVLESYTLDSKRRKSEAELIRQDKAKPPTAPSLEGGCEPA